MHDLEILADQLQTGFTRLLGRTRADDDNISILTSIVISSIDLLGCREDSRVFQVQSITFSPLLRQINDGELFGKPLLDHRKGVG